MVSRNPVASLMYLVLNLFSLAGLFVMLDAHFLAAVQVIVYAGAIMVLFLFVIMLLNLGHDAELPDFAGAMARLLAGAFVHRPWPRSRRWTLLRGAIRWPPPVARRPTRSRPP